MYLKRVELAGFKSFADRTELEFVPGITGVVGPNGSGKSNITDAIRWVLGEQSAKSLRGGKMEDIIFLGSDSRKPVNFAEVSLTLDNQDRSLDIEYSEVTITRRLFRSGESEYFLNKQSCRLKDIIELLMDTGLGKEAYSIIGQGKIEEILSSKAEDRRGVFEEAAGIVKYKSRKREAKKKLEDTEHNLIRISDLISELEGQVAPLEEQASKAKLYKEHAGTLRELNIQIYVHDIEKTYEDWQETDKIQKQLAAEQISLGTEVNQIDASIEKKRWEISQLESQLDELHKQLVNISERVEQAEGKREVLKEREKNRDANRSQSIEQLDKYLAKKADLLAQLEEEKEKLQEIEGNSVSFLARLEDEENFLNQLTTNQEAQIEAYKEDYFEILNELASFRNDLRHLASSRESLIYRLDKLKSELELTEQHKEGASKRKQLMNEELLDIQASIETISRQYNEGLIAEKDLNISLQSGLQELREEEQRLTSVLSRQEVLADMQADFSGFNLGVKEILKLRESKRLHGVHGAVAELITTPKQYETAIEQALGGSLQYIVVEQEQVAREAISFLKERRIGRATFLPLETIRGKRLNEFELNKISGTKGFIGIAADLVQMDEKYANITNSLLGQVIVVTDLRIANEIARLLGFSKRIVTLDGDIVNPGGSMTGGSINKKNVSILSRQRELEELSIQIENLRKNISIKQNNSENIEKNLKHVRISIEELRAKNEQTKLKEQEIQGKLQQLVYEFSEAVKKSDVLDHDIEQLRQELKELNEKEELLSKELEINNSKEKAVQEKITSAESMRKQDESTKSAMSEKIMQIKIDMARLSQERDGKKEFVDKLSADLLDLNLTIEHNEQSLIKLESEQSNQKSDQESILQAIEQLRFTKDQTQKQIEEIRLHRSKRVQEIDAEEAGAKELRKNLRTIEAGLHQSEVKLSRLDVELENLLRQLTEEYEMSYEWAKDYIEKVENIQLAKGKVKELKSQIQSLGEVNLGAIEEFERVSERFSFLTVQKKDLVEAKETLYQVIEEVDEEMTKRFKVSFELIREQFQIVFTKLFNGGRADLILTDTDNMLETGVEIVAQPPGKKLQNLALLSGGEKALTAITLLFAILRIKPVPFCVLDEVEAALDEANVSRFSDYLREFCDLTQFIVVTHRKGTMEGADVLYGITMQESGVSRLVSVKLEDKSEVGQLA